MPDHVDLTRFTKAHKRSYKTALEEIRLGKKQTHWMWYIFPQIHGLGHSETAIFYSIRNLAEAKAFLSDPYLGNNLTEISHALLTLKTDNPFAVFGSTDAKKLLSSMTLFTYISENGSVFHRVLDKYYGGKQDIHTLTILQDEQKG